MKAAAEELPEERGRVQNLARRVTELEQQLVAQTKEAEILGRRAQDLESRLGDNRGCSTRANSSSSNCVRNEAARKTESDLRTAITEIDGRSNSAPETQDRESSIAGRTARTARSATVSPANSGN